MLLVFFVFFVILVLLGAAGLGLGFLLHWMIPAVGVGVGTLIGVVTIGLSVHFVVRLFGAAFAIEQEERLATSLWDLQIAPPRPRRRKR